MKKNKDTHRSVARTLNLLRFGWFFNFFMMIAPVIVLVYTQKGITVGDFFPYPSPVPRFCVLV